MSAHSPVVAARPVLALIAALDANRVIGRANAMPWHLPADLRRFKSLTLGHPVIMGRKTHESIGRVLPGRCNIIVTRQADYAAEGCVVASSLEAALAAAGDAPEIFLIGGGELYREAFDRADRLYLTEIAAEFEGDAWFPDFDRREWRETARERHAATPELPFAYSFVRYERIMSGAGRGTIRSDTLAG